MKKFMQFVVRCLPFVAVLISLVAVHTAIDAQDRAINEYYALMRFEDHVDHLTTALTRLESQVTLVARDQDPEIRADVARIKDALRDIQVVKEMAGGTLTYRAVRADKGPHDRDADVMP